MNTIKPVPKRRSDPEMQNYLLKGENGVAARRGIKQSDQPGNDSPKPEDEKK